MGVEVRRGMGIHDVRVAHGGEVGVRQVRCMSGGGDSRERGWGWMWDMEGEYECVASDSVFMWP